MIHKSQLYAIKLQRVQKRYACSDALCFDFPLKELSRPLLALA
jgi:hypothetical protein